MSVENSDNRPALEKMWNNGHNPGSDSLGSDFIPVNMINRTVIQSKPLVSVLVLDGHQFIIYREARGISNNTSTNKFNVLYKSDGINKTAIFSTAHSSYFANYNADIKSIKSSLN